MMYTCQKLGSFLTVCCFQLLEDKNGEVQNLAVRCLGPLVGKVKEYQVEGIVDSLGRTRYQFFSLNIFTLNCVRILEFS